MGHVVELKGAVCSGLGEGAHFTQLDWALDQFASKLGFAPYPGTFNLRMEGPEWEGLRVMCASYEGIDIEPPAGFCAARCYRVRINEHVVGAALFPEVDDYPADKVEIVAPVSVRETLGVGDGDTVKVQFDLG